MMTMVALLAMTAAMAQQSDNNEQNAPKRLTPEEVTDNMTKSLSLTDEQKVKVLALNKEYSDVIGGPGMGGPRMGRRPNGPRPDASTGASEQAKPQGDRPERPQLTDAQREEMRQRMEKRREYNDKLKGILTAEQMENYQKMNGPRRGGGRRGGGPRGNQ